MPDRERLWRAPIGSFGAGVHARHRYGLSVENEELPDDVIVYLEVRSKSRPSSPAMRRLTQEYNNAETEDDKRRVQVLMIEQLRREQAERGFPPTDF